MQYAMVIDVSKCIGCRACAVACKLNNNLPDGIWYNRVDTEGTEVSDTAVGAYPDSLSFSYLPIACQHCSAPSCVAVCPVDATWREEESGLVVIDAEKCIGCKLCIEACPYQARSYVQDVAYQTDFAFGDWDAPAHLDMKVEKCTFCTHRLERGEVPACMELCLGRCRFWGDIDDPESDVAKYIAGRETFHMLEEAGTAPNTIYVR
jgi:molybdopterin-containing oxidoreductase family iron-sulfur binding subunit